MVLGKRWLFSIWNGAEIRPLEKGRKPPALCNLTLKSSAKIFSQNNARSLLKNVQNPEILIKIQG